MNKKPNARHVAKVSVSKLLLIIFIGAALILTVLTLMMAQQPDHDTELIEILKELTEVWYGGTTIVVGFYLWKARSENRNKYSQLWYEKIASEHGWEAAARFAEIVTRGD